MLSRMIECRMLSAFVIEGLPMSCVMPHAQPAQFEQSSLGKLCGGPQAPLGKTTQPGRYSVPRCPRSQKLCCGSGGKYTWGGVMDSDDVRALDPKDPNYDSEAEASPPSYHSQLGGHVKAYKQAVSSLETLSFVMLVNQNGNRAANGAAFAAVGSDLRLLTCNFHVTMLSMPPWLGI